MAERVARSYFPLASLRLTHTSLKVHLSRSVGQQGAES